MPYTLREKILFYSIFFSVFIILTTELLSFLNSLNRFTITTCWLVFLSFLFFLHNQSVRKNHNLSTKKKFQIYIFIIFIILILTFLIAIIYPPTTPDSMSYHMTRVMQWVQNNNIDFFPTSSTRQLIMSPFAEYVILHLYLITNSDILSNLGQLGFNQKTFLASSQQRVERSLNPFMESFNISLSLASADAFKDLIPCLAICS